MREKFGYSPKVSVTQSQKATYVAFANRTVQAAGEATLRYFREGMEAQNKATGSEAFDPVTEADRAAETIIRDALAREFPTHGICGEEFGYESGNGLTWVIDPIDGTREFMSGMLQWGVLLALFDGDTPIIGAMYQPYTGELFYGDAERSFFVRGGHRRQMSTAANAEVSEAVLASTGLDWFNAVDRRRFDQLRKQVRLCRFGGDCYLYALVAMGHIHLGTDAGLNAYDIQALIPIIQGAGGVVSTYEGGNASMGGSVLASANAGLHTAALEMLNR